MKSPRFSSCSPGQSCVVKGDRLTSRRVYFRATQLHSECSSSSSSWVVVSFGTNISSTCQYFFFFFYYTTYEGQSVLPELEYHELEHHELYFFFFLIGGAIVEFARCDTSRFRSFFPFSSRCVKIVFRSEDDKRSPRFAINLFLRVSLSLPVRRIGGEQPRNEGIFAAITRRSLTVRLPLTGTSRFKLLRRFIDERPVRVLSLLTGGPVL